MCSADPSFTNKTRQPGTPRCALRTLLFLQVLHFCVEFAVLPPPQAPAICSFLSTSSAWSTRGRGHAAETSLTEHTTASAPPQTWAHTPNLPLRAHLGRDGSPISPAPRDPLPLPQQTPPGNTGRPFRSAWAAEKLGHARHYREQLHLIFFYSFSLESPRLPKGFLLEGRRTCPTRAVQPSTDHSNVHRGLPLDGRRRALSQGFAFSCH